MNARESRIGNLLTYNGFIVEVVEVKKLHLMVRFLNKENQNEMMSEHDNFNGIELNEEWLLRFGFDNKFNKGKFNIIPKGRLGYKNGRTYFNSWTILEKQPDYVHELQNLYFALTGKELTIKE